MGREKAKGRLRRRGGGGTNAEVTAAAVGLARVEALEPRQLLADVTGAMRAWQPVTLDFRGPVTSETATSPNPFLDYRLQVRLTNASTGATLNIPGYYDGDGQGGAAGNVWRARFTPPTDGTWTYTASFRQGSQVAVNLSATAGTATSFNGDTGSFAVAAPDAAAPGFLAKGRLRYAGGHYLRFDDGSWFLKTGVTSPENFLAFDGFDNTVGTHRYDAHEPHWQAGDPDWGAGRARGIIGALNYLSSRNVNEVMFMTMNIGGDAQDVHPWVGPIVRAGSATNDNVHYDLSKLRQWGTVFEHAERRSLRVHLVFGEAEEPNKRELDNATLGPERKLFYREMVARYAHINAIQFNLMEEYDWKLVLTPSTIKQFIGYLDDVEPYGNVLTVNNQRPDITGWTPFFGDDRFGATSIQYYQSVAGYGLEVEKFRTQTTAAGHPLPVFMDEIRGTVSTNMVAQRKEFLYSTLFSGGGLGYFFYDQDRTLDSFVPYESQWNWTWYARRFMEQNLPFTQMQPADDLLTGESTTLGFGQVFAKANHVYAVYLPVASATGTLSLAAASGTFAQRWYNPRTGLFEGTTRQVNAGGSVSLGAAPSAAAEDWVVLFERIGGPGPLPPPAAPTGLTASGGTDRVTLAWADNSNDETGFEVERSTDNVTFELLATRPAGATTYTDTAVAAGVTYYYRVRAAHATAASAYTPAAAAALVPPDAALAVTGLMLIDADRDTDLRLLVDDDVLNLATLPTRRLNVRADTSALVESVRFAMDANANYRTESGKPFALQGDSGGNYAAWTPTVGTHTLRVTPYSADNAAGTVGAAVTITFTVVDQPAPPGPVAAPTGLVATAPSATRVTLAWLDNATDETGYEAERSVDGGQTYERVAALAAGTRSYTDTTVAPDTSYAYRVRAVRGSEPSADSNIAAVTTPAPRAAPAAPPSLTAAAAAALGSGRIDLTWSAPTAGGAPEGYRVEQSTDDGATWVQIAEVAPSATTFANHGLAASTTYHYRVLAFNAGGTSAPSPVAFATTAPAPAAGITSLSLLNADTGAFIMTLVPGMRINLAALPTRRLAVRAETAGTIGSVRFGLDANANHRTENGAPYSLHGDSGGVYKAWTPTVGNHTITATAFSLSNGGGTIVGTSLVIGFEVIDVPL